MKPTENQLQMEENKLGAERSEENNGNGNGKRRHRIGLVLLLLILLGTMIGSWLWFKSKIELATDDAFIENHIHRVSARIAGQVIAVPVSDNQRVAAGELLVTLDPANYQAQVAKAEARMALAKNTTEEEQAAVAAATAIVKRAQAQFDQTTADQKRGEALYDREVIPKERLEQLKTAHQVAKASLEQARQQLLAAKARFGANDNNQQARVSERAAELELARLNLSYTRIVAPVDGYVTRKSVQLGNNVQPGQSLLAIVELERPWIIANYKERQLTYLEPGQRVEFRVDAYPGKIFTGKVDSIMAGTGAAFSLLPPENATGNYVKVVQRVPVKITIDPNSDPQHQLRVGMSVEPIIFTGRSLGDILEHLNPFN
ncbi:HlyD family secretion protein [Malonomonas rubra]|uniref:HlyD family secretion protein n=1 Tax=Malonomonas rubra TaxID=57040 RepID=UPI0026EDDDF4|nr:HlyD family secretion protein [Malonomonas rubra]